MSARYPPSPFRKLDPKNMGGAVGIALISCVQVKTHAIEVHWPTSYMYPLPVQSHRNLIGLYGKLDCNNIGISVGITFISCLEMEKHSF